MRLTLLVSLAVALAACGPEWAARRGSVDAVRQYLDKGGRPDSEMLHQAGINGNVELVKLLIDRGANPGDGAFDYVESALQFHSPQAALYLAQHGAPVSDEALAISGPLRSQLARIRRAQDAAPQAADLQAGAAAAAETAETSDVDSPDYRLHQSTDDYAVVVGIEKYPDLPPAQYAERDAKAMEAHLLALGVPQRNIFMLTGSAATRSGLVKNLESRLPNLVDRNSTVFFYYSGHGAPDPRTGQAFLLPVDGDPKFLDATAYPLSRLYQKLAALPAKRVIVALDSCFSGAGGRSVVPKGVRPLVAKVDTAPTVGAGKIVALTASAGDEISGTNDAQGHGLFTYYLLKGLNDGKRTTGELYRYLKPRVQDAARRDNRDQTPALIGGDTPL